MKLNPIPEKLYGADNYMELESKDVRLSVCKINDFIETLGDASISLIYSDEEEYKNLDEKFLNIIRRIHIRHALIDLNNCFDILLQIPWFHYRIWKEYNTNGKYYNSRYHKGDIIRNSQGWVEKVENSCSYIKVTKYLKDSNDPKLKEFYKELTMFNDEFRFNSNKKVQIRAIANQLKHRHNIKLKEFHEPTKLTLNVNGNDINFEEKNLVPVIRSKFYDKDTNLDCGEIVIRYEDDLNIDINYNSGEVFYGKDIINLQSLFSFDELLSEMVEYTNSIILLYEKLYDALKDNIQINPMTKEPKITKVTEYNLDNYFKNNVEISKEQNG